MDRRHDPLSAREDVFMIESCRNTSFGPLRIAEEENAIVRLSFAPVCDVRSSDVSSPLLDEAFRQLEEYFSGRRREFALPLHPSGTAFMKKVWARLREIPYGETASYKEIAVSVGVPGGMRAVGMANNRNPIAIVIPCHRVIGADGSLVGYAGGLELKRRLLALERGGSLKKDS